ncbi:MAG: heme-binding protein [Pseudomonadota bacterium]
MDRLIFFAALFALFLPGAAMADVETPNYTVEARDGEVEIRQYPSMIVAQTTVEGTRSAAVNQGFRILADYIFGANEPNAKIEMTAPVTQAAGGDSIAMTAPVTQSQADGGEGSWDVRFIMPSEYTIATLPLPTDKRIDILEIGPRRVAAIQFSGFARDAKLAEKRDALMAYLARNEMQAASAPTFAFYDPPFTLPFLRRNEVLVELARAGGGAADEAN